MFPDVGELPEVVVGHTRKPVRLGRVGANTNRPFGLSVSNLVQVASLHRQSLILRSVKE